MTTWSKEAVLEELIQAFRIDDMLPGGIGPRRIGSAMPDFLRSANDWREAGSTAFSIERDRRNATIERRAQATSRQVSDMEAAFGWVLDHVANEEHRRCLFAYAMVKARGWDWSRYLGKRNRRNSTKSAWSRQTTYRWVWAACQAIADALDNRGVPLPEWRDLQVRHEAAETPSEPVRSGSSAWMAPDAVPRNLPGHPDRSRMVERISRRSRVGSY